MIKIQKVAILVIFIILLFMNVNISFAEAQIQIISDKEVIETEEDVNICIELSHTEIATLTLEIYWDNTKLNYIGGPETSNNSNNRILYTWVNESGQNTEALVTENFIFQGTQEGIASIVVTGEFYNAAGEKIDINDDHFEIQVGKEEIVTQEERQGEGNVSTNNTNLSVLRLNHEGISPDFNQNIKEYYFIADKSIENLNVTAIPENSNAIVDITGNKNLKMGKNEIKISVQSQDKTDTSIYRIYVTRTENIEMANANLETLAVRQATLNPDFDSNMTKYKIEIANDIDKIDVLAIPQKENATVKIEGNGEMNIGDNKIEVIVLAEDGITDKKYEITVHRRNEDEEVEYEQKKKLQIERLSSIIEKEENENKDASIENKKPNQIFLIIVLIIIIGIVIGMILYFRIKKKHKNESSIK